MADERTLEIVEFEESPNPREEYHYYGGRQHRAERGDRPSDPSRVFVSVEGEGFWDDFANRTSRPHTLWRPLVIKALQDAGVKFTKVIWSQKAGCKMCPCSPGFYVHGREYPGKDYWLTVRMSEPATTDPATSDWRKLQVLADPTMPVGTDEQKNEAQELLAEVLKKK